MNSGEINYTINNRTLLGMYVFALRCTHPDYRPSNTATTIRIQ